LVPPERHHVDAGVGRERTQRDPKRGGRVAQPRAVHVQVQATRVRQVRQRTHLGNRVDGPELGRLRDRHDPRLNRVLIADARDQALGALDRELSVRVPRREQLDARYHLGRAALVDVQVRRVGADRGLPALAAGAQGEHIGPGAVEHQERPHLLAEMLSEARLHGLGPRVVPVAVGVAHVETGDRLEHGRMHGRRVVGGESASRGGPGHAAASLVFSEL
jgi:hypothetical protein